MTLRLYNTLTRRKDVFKPFDEHNVRMYVCGPTVYDFAHIGNARPVIVFDVLFRLLRHLYGADHVTYVRNITDVDDKINARAARDYPGLPLNDAINKITEETNAWFQQDVAALGCLQPTHQPRATEHIPGMIAMIERLIERGKAYPAEGHVLFHVPSDPAYGSLARRSPDEMLAGARVDVAPYKRDPMDFVLWKPSTADEPGWESPWGRGRPGWHIECSAMSWRYLGEQFDIHGGGIDLVFPHHENERAQSCCAFDRPVMAKWWMHNGFLQVEGQKMSKSLGNFVTIRDVLKDWPGEVARFNMLKTHYRQPIDWTVRGLEEAQKTLHHWYDMETSVPADFNPQELADETFFGALKDDLNTWKAISRLHEMAAEIRGPSSGPIQLDLKKKFKFAANLLGLLAQSKDDWMSRWVSATNANEANWIADLIDQRLAARRNKNWAEADRIRDLLAAHRIVLKDIKNPETGEPDTEWESAR